MKPQRRAICGSQLQTTTTFLYYHNRISDDPTVTNVTQHCPAQLNSLVHVTICYSWPLLIPVTCQRCRASLDRHQMLSPSGPSASLRSINQIADLSATEVLSLAHRNPGILHSRSWNWWRGLSSTQSEGIQSCILVCAPTFGLICRNYSMKCCGFRVCNSLFTHSIWGGLWKQSVERQRDDSDVAMGVNFRCCFVVE